MIHQERDVLAPVAQRRDVNADDIETVEQILAEPTMLDLGFQVAVGRGENAHIGPQGGVASDPGKFPRLEDSEQFALDFQGHFTDFVEEQGASVALLETALPLGHGPGESPFFMAEQFAFKQIGRDRGTVDGDVFTGGSAAEAVGGVGDDFLPDATFPGDQDRHVGAGDPTDQFNDILHRLRPSDDQIRVGGWYLGNRRLRLAGGQLHLLGGLETAFGGRLQFKAERLPTEDVEGPVAHCFDHRIGRSEISVEDHRRIGELLPDPLEHLDAVDRSHAQLGEQQVALAFNEDFDGGSGIRGGHDLETGGLQVALGP